MKARTNKADTPGAGQVARGRYTEHSPQDVIAEQFPRVDPELAEFAFLIHDIGRRIQWFVEGFVRNEPIDHSSFMVLLVLRARGCRQPFGDLAREVLLTSGGFANAVNRLENQGLVKRERDAVDGRRTWIGITGEGHRLVGEMLERYMDEFAEKAKAITARKRRALLGDLRLLETMLAG